MRHEALALFEQGIKSRYELDVVIGIDEAGRGSLAGPVYAGACAITDPQNTSFINDSKLLSPSFSPRMRCSQLAVRLLRRSTRTGSSM
jgi:hypothetical protein